MQSPIPFGQKLQTLLDRLQPQRTQAWLADMTGLERSTISRLIRGERNPTFETVQCLAPVLGLTVEEMVQGTDAQSRLQEATQLVRREDYEAVVQKLVEYEGRLNDAEMKLRAETSTRTQDEERWKKAESERREAQDQAEAAQRELVGARERAQQLQFELSRSQSELTRYQKALHKAVAEVSMLRANLQQMAKELKETSQSSRTAALLAGIAAVTGVVTAASFLGSGSDEGGKKTSAQKEKPKASGKSQ